MRWSQCQKRLGNWHKFSKDPLVQSGTGAPQHRERLRNLSYLEQRRLWVDLRGSHQEDGARLHNEAMTMS